MAPPDDAALSAAGPSLSLDGFASWVMSGLLASVGWAAPRAPHPNGPGEPSGTAAGHGHLASAAATRVGRGAGRKPGNGKGELPAAPSTARHFRVGPSAGPAKGFARATSIAVSGKSTATSTYYDNADGTHTRILSTGPVNYRSGKAWHPIDTSVRKSSDGRWRERANSVQVQFAPYADDPRVATVGVDADHTASEQLIGASHVPGISMDSAVTYSSVLPHTDLRVQATATGEKESVILRDASAAATWDFALDLHGLSASLSESGSVVLKNAAGKELLMIPAGYAWDSAPAPPGPATSHGVTYAVEGSVLRMSVDLVWLHDPARVFPVTVDPTLSTMPPTTYVEQNSTPADHSVDPVIKVGTADSGAHTDRAFMTFTGLGVQQSNVSVTAASLTLFDVYSSTCTASRFDVAPVTQPWVPADSLSYPGPTMGASIGNLTPAVPKSCANTSRNVSVGDALTVPLSASAFNSISSGAIDAYGLGLYTTTSTQKWFAGAISLENSPMLSLTYSGYLLPMVLTQSPASGSAVGSLTPTLSALGWRDPLLAVYPKYKFQVVNASGTKVADSGLLADGSYTVPPGALQWGQIYSWTVQDYDGTNYSVNPAWYQMSTQVPQPAVTSTLSQNPGHGFDASIGNYTTSSTDADVATSGPPLSVVRSYNSRDPRNTGSFGSAWASSFDARATERYNINGSVSTVVLTYPDGSDVAYGRNADGSFTAPAGRAAKLIHLSNGYELIDKAITTYVFTQSLSAGVYGLTSIVDVSRRAVNFTWAAGHVITMTSAVSGRALHLAWSTPPGATTAHVATVSTDSVTPGQSDAYTWTYVYLGDRLTSVCPPGTTTACTRYGYDAGAAAGTRNEVLDLGAQSYWPLGETTGSKAASAVATSEGTDDATYSNVTLGATPGPLAGSAVAAPTFNGTSSRVNLPDLELNQSMTESISLWFKAAAGAPAGVLWSQSSMPIAATASSGNSVPTLYLGTDGKLLGEFWISSVDLAANPITTAASVADGKWHNVVLTDSRTAQVMFVDGERVGSIAGWGTDGGREELIPSDAFYNYLGTGYLGPSEAGNGVWPDQPHTNASVPTNYGSYFKGALADAAFFEDKALSLADETAIYTAGLHQQTLMTSATRPSGKAYSAVTYDPVSSTVSHLVDENGGSWTLAAPKTTGSSQVYRAAVLGSAPTAYYRLGDAAGSTQAFSDVHYATAPYTSTTLGEPGPFSDASAATFNGATSSVSLPKATFGSAASSQELWFKTANAAGGVLLSSQNSALGGTTCPCLPTMWVTPDGMLRALSPSTTPTGPIASAAGTGKCLDDPNTSTVDGTKVEVWTCNGSTAQNWTLYPDGTVRVAGKCLDLAGGATVSGTLVDISTCTAAARQQWQSYQGTLRNPNTGLCLDNPSNSTTNGTQFEIYACNVSSAQKWAQSLVSTKLVTDNVWHHAVLSTDGTNQQLYVDGRLAGFSKGAEPLHPGPLGFSYLGAGYSGNNAAYATPLDGLPLGTTRYFAGSLAEVAFYPAALSVDDAAAHYAAAKNSSGTTPMTTVTVTDPGGHPLVNQYDPLNNNRQIASIDALGHKTSFGYDAGGFQHTVTDPDGNVTTTGHDGDGNTVSTTTCQDRAANVCSTQYATFQPNSMGVDAALRSIVTSSGDSGATGLPAAALADGNTASVTGALGFETALQTSASVAQWIQLDMGKANAIDQVALYPRTDVAGGFPLTFTIQVSADGTTWKTETSQTNYAVPAAGQQALFSFAPITARYVKLNATALRLSPAVGKYAIDLAELTARNDNPDPTAGIQLTQRDGRSSSASDDTFLTSYGHDGLGNVTSVTTPAVDGAPDGRTTKIAYTDGSTVAATDTGFAPAGLPYRTTSPGGAVNLVSYLSSGDVASTTDPDGLVTKFGYDNLGRVIGKTVVSDSYPAGLTTFFSYDAQDEVVTETAPPVADRISGKVHTARTTSIFDPDGNITSQTMSDTTGGDVDRTTKTTFTGYDQVGSSTDPESNTTTYAYDAYGERTSETDPQGNRTEYTFDANGHLLTQVLAGYVGDPAAPQTPAPLTELSRAYDPAGRLASLTDAMGETTRYTYTDNGLPATVTRTDFAGKNPYVEKNDAYDAAGNLVKEITNNGATTTVVKVDAASRATSSTIDPDGVDRTTTLTFTPDDAVASNVTKDGSGATVSTTAMYDPMGHLNSKSVRTNTPGYTDALTTTWQLDQRGLPSSQTDPDGNVTDFLYDEAGQLTTSTAAAAPVETGGAAAASKRSVTKQGYDTAGEPVETQDPNGNVTDTGYDRDGHTVSTTTPDYLPPGSSVPISATITSKYDAAGNMIESRDAAQNLTSYLYDQLGDVAQVTTPDRGVTHSTFDADGRMRTVTDPTGAQKQATYDHLGRMLTRTVIERYPAPTALTTTYSYDPAPANPSGAWQSSTTTPAGVITATGYDNLGEPISRTDGAGNTTRIRYDLLGRAVAQTLPDGTSTDLLFDQGSNPVRLRASDVDGTVLTTKTATYDADGNKLTATDARGHTTRFTYDAINQLTTEIQPVTDTTSITTSFGHDAAGNRTRFTDGRDNVWTYAYNSWELPESETEPATAAHSSIADRTTTTSYDNRALVVGQTLPGGVALNDTYDVSGNLTSTAGAGADATTATRTFAYDKDRRVISAATGLVGSAPATTEDFGYDDRGDLLSAAGDGGTSSFGYNADGAMSTRTDAAGTTAYGYDGTGRLTKMDDAASGTRLGLSYNKVSQVSSIEYGSGGNVRSFVYDALHRLTSDRLATKDDATVASIQYGYDNNGSVTSKKSTGFGTATTNTYEYDQADRLTSWNNGTATVAYGYDDSGNRVRVGSDVYTYDARDELTSDGHNSYDYTARGTRLRENDVVTNSDAYGQTTATGTHAYTYDALGRTLTADDTKLSYSGSTNAVAADGQFTYSRDPGGSLSGIATSVVGSGRLAYTDSHTDVVGTFGATDSTLTASEAYDPLGNVLEHGGTVGNLGYQSGWTDPASGNVNMAARWYNPGNGQFMNKDTQAQNPVPNSAAANPFAFVDDNPMTGTDPSGHGLLSDAWNWTKSAVSTAWNWTKTTVSSAWNWTKSTVSSAWDATTSFLSDTWDSAVNAANQAANWIDDEYNKEKKKFDKWIAAEKRKYAAINAAIRKKARN